MLTLDFNGKSFIYDYHRFIPEKKLVPDYQKSLNSAAKEDNLIIHGDNLYALKILLSGYCNKIKCIYIDPPYNTGNSNWLYKDNMKSSFNKKWFDNIELGNLSRHDKWICMMWPRLRLLRELLTDDGVIFISISDHEFHHLRIIMNEIFGEKNFIANIIWQHRKDYSNQANISISHSYLLCYARNSSLFSFIKESANESKFSNPDHDPRGPWLARCMDAPYSSNKSFIYEIVNPNTGQVFHPPKGRTWLFTLNKFNELLKDNRIIFGKSGKTRPYYKKFLSDAYSTPCTIWNDVGSTRHGTSELKKILGDKVKNFPYPKPVSLLTKILKMTTNKNDIVLDSFAGSGTTAQAVIQLNKQDNGNRKFILVECEDYANSITAERIRRVIHDKELEESFTYCTIDTR